SGRLAATSLLAVRGPRDTSLRGCAPTLPGGREFRHLSIKNRQRLRQTDVGGSDRVFARAESPFRGMTNDERMTNAPMTNDEPRGLERPCLFRHSGFVLRDSFVIRHSTFVILPELPCSTPSARK